MAAPTHQKEDETSSVDKINDNKSTIKKKDDEIAKDIPPPPSQVKVDEVKEEVSEETKKNNNQKINEGEKTNTDNKKELSVAEDNVEDKEEDKEEEEDNEDTIEYSVNTDTDIDSENESDEDTIPQIQDISQNKNIPSCDKTERTLEKKAELCEINVDLPENSESVRLKEPIEVYKEIYSKALGKAKEARRLAVQAFLEAKHIKNTFLSGEIDDSDDDFDSFKEDMSC